MIEEAIIHIVSIFPLHIYFVYAFISIDSFEKENREMSVSDPNDASSIDRYHHSWTKNVNQDFK